MKNLPIVFDLCQDLLPDKEIIVVLSVCESTWYLDHTHDTVLMTPVYKVLTAASYSGGLSNPLVCPESSLPMINSDILHEFHCTNYTGPRMALAVSGAEHQDVLRWVEPMLQGASNAGKVTATPSTYVGGEVRIPGGDDLTHIILAFDSPVSVFDYTWSTYLPLIYMSNLLVSPLYV